MRKFLGLAAIAAMLCCSACHNHHVTIALPSVKGVTFTEVSEADCKLTVKATVRTATRDARFVDSFFDIFLGTDGMTMDDLLAHPGSPVGSVKVAGGDVDGDGFFDVEFHIDLTPGHHPVAIRGHYGNTIGATFPVGVFAGSVPAGISELGCVVVGTDVSVTWSNLGPANSITLVLRPGAENEQRMILDGSATSANLTAELASSVGETIQVFATNCFGNSEVVSCVVARPGTPFLSCSLDNDKIVLSWSSEALSVELFENGVSLGTQEPNGTLRLCDRNPGKYCYTAIGTGLEGQEAAVSDTARCELYRKSRLLLTDRCDGRDVARVLLDGDKDPPVLLNAKVLTLNQGDTTGDMRFCFRTHGSCATIDSFFDITYRIESAEVNGEPAEVCNSEEGHIRFDVCEPGLYSIVVHTGDTIETEIVSLDLTGSIQVNQTETSLFGEGSQELCIPSAEYADAFIDNQSNVGNRVVLVPEIVKGQGVGYGFGVGTAQGWDYVNLDVTGSAWFSKYVKLYGSGTGTFFDNTSPIFPFLGSTDSVVVPVSVDGTISGSVGFDLDAKGWNYISLPVHTSVFTEVCVWVPIIATKDVCSGFVTELAGCNAIGAPDCKAFGLGGEGGFLSLAFTDNVIYNGDGYDLRIYERDEGNATEILSGLITLSKFFDVSTAEAKNWMPVDRNIQIPTDQLAPQLTAPLGFIVSRDGDDYECGYTIDIDLGVLADRLEKQIGEGAVPRAEAINLLTFISQGGGNTIEGNFRDLFSGADIDSVKGLHNRFGLRVCPTNCNSEEQTQSFRDVPVGCLFLNNQDQQESYYRNCRNVWRYKLTGQVFCRGFTTDPLLTNEVCVESYLRPYHVRHHLKCNAISALAHAAEDAGMPFGLDD